MWGMATAGISQFKQGFGGHEIGYIGAFDLVTSAPLRTAFRAYQGVRVQRRQAAAWRRGRTDLVND